MKQRIVLLLSMLLFAASASASTVPSYTGQSVVNGHALLVASFTTTAVSSESVTITGMTSAGHCVLTPTNASASTNVATTFISAKTTNAITLAHTATAGMTYDFTCTPN
jgi:hypothetical protein